MLVNDFESFSQQAEELYRARPLDTRYTVKYRHCDGKLVLKVTDDLICLKFTTDQQTDLKKLERLTNLFFTLMARGDVPEGEAPVLLAAESNQATAERAGHSATAGAVGGAGGRGSMGAGSGAAGRGSKKSRRKG